EYTVKAANQSGEYGLFDASAGGESGHDPLQILTRILEYREIPEPHLVRLTVRDLEKKPAALGDEHPQERGAPLVVLVGPFDVVSLRGPVAGVRPVEGAFSNLILGEPGIPADQRGVASSGIAKPLVDEAITTTLRLPRGFDAFLPCCFAVVAHDAG